MKTRIKTIALPAAGIIVGLAGFVYDVLFAGIPYQDPTPAMQTRYDFHASVAGWIYTAGGIIFLAGIIAIPVVWLTATSERSIR